jgi:hypothetical protein
MLTYSCSSFVDTIQNVDGFKYSERSAKNKDGDDGIRFKYVCADSVQSHKGGVKKEKEGENVENETRKRKRTRKPEPTTYACGGAIHIKFSIERAAINVVYKHNPIHRDMGSRPETVNR